MTAGSQAAGRLDAQSSQIHALLDSLNADLAAVFAATAGANTDDEHDPEGSTIAFERSQLLQLIDDARARLDDVETARARLANGQYGRCERCGNSIAATRLAARPASRRCIRCAT